jgi:pimeloyl-ACP methyl ester carboxylesterase
MKLRMGEFEVGYDARGSGPALMLLHAFPFDRRMWSEQVANLSDGRRVIAIDLCGFGETPLWKAPSIDDLADDVCRALDTLGIAMASVCGLSMGGYVALSLAARHRARLSSLILADTRAAADGEVAKAARETTIAQVKHDGPNGYLSGIPQRLLSRHADDTLRQHVRELCCDRVETIVAATRAMRDRPERTAMLGEIDCPALVICGGEDAASTPAEMRGLAEELSDGEYVEIAGAGHLSNLEAPERFNEAVARFLHSHDL